MSAVFVLFRGRVGRGEGEKGEWCIGVVNGEMMDVQLKLSYAQEGILLFIKTIGIWKRLLTRPLQN